MKINLFGGIENELDKSLDEIVWNNKLIWD